MLMYLVVEFRSIFNLLYLWLEHSTFHMSISNSITFAKLSKCLGIHLTIRNDIFILHTDLVFFFSSNKWVFAFLRYNWAHKVRKSVEQKITSCKRISWQSRVLVDHLPIAINKIQIFFHCGRERSISFFFLEKSLKRISSVTSDKTC